MSKEELFRSRVHLFSGYAADFVAMSTHIHSWDQLIFELTRYCLWSTSDTDVLQKIEQKRQGAENAAVYYTCIDLMFQSLRRPINEQEQVEIIIVGIRPEIRQSLPVTHWREWCPLLRSRISEGQHKGSKSYFVVPNHKVNSRWRL